MEIAFKGDYLCVEPKCSFSAMCEHCYVLCSLGRSHSEIATTLYSEVHMPILQEMLKVFPICLDTFSMLKQILSHIVALNV
jgi:hypothetical protein